MSNLTPAEQTLIEKARVGEIADYRSRSAALDDLARGASWGDQRTIRAEIIYALAVGTNPAWTVHAQGVRIKGARIIGALDLTAAKICPLRIQQCSFQEAVNLSYASASFIYLSGSFVPDLTADRLECRGSLRLDNGFCSKGGVSLVGARIGGDLVCVGATLLNSRSVALSADGLVVEGSVLLRDGFRASGVIRLVGARIGGNLACGGAKCKNPRAVAIAGDGLEVKGDVYLRHGFRAQGAVNLVNAHIGGTLDCGGGRFHNPAGAALSGDSLVVEGHVLLRENFCARGAVSLVAARVGGDLDCHGASFKNPGVRSLSIQRCKIGGALALSKLSHRPEGLVDFTAVEVGELFDDKDSWPASNQLFLEGFVYRALATMSPTDAKDRIDWLNLQPKFQPPPNERLVQFWPQPYEQLARVLKQMGHESAARVIAVEKRWRAGEHKLVGWAGWLKNRFLWITTNYGYSPFRAIIWLLLLSFLIGPLGFSSAHRAGLVVPKIESAYQQYTTKGSLPSGYEPFNPWHYALDLLPPLDLGQKANWHLYPMAGISYSRYRFYFAFLAGYVLSCYVLLAIAVAAFTGLIKKD